MRLALLYLRLTRPNARAVNLCLAPQWGAPAKVGKGEDTLFEHHGLPCALNVVAKHGNGYSQNGGHEKGSTVLGHRRDFKKIGLACALHHAHQK